MSEATGSRENPRAGVGWPAKGVLPSGRAAEVAPRHTISLGALMVVIAFVAVFLAISLENIGYGITSLSIAIMALDRTAQKIAERKARGRPMAPAEKAVLLLISTGCAVLLVGLGLLSIVLFLAVCWLVVILLHALGSWGATAVVVLVIVASATFRHRRDLRSRDGEDPGLVADRRADPR
jgi:small-conductance mechanosensitive channel